MYTSLMAVGQSLFKMKSFRLGLWAAVLIASVILFIAPSYAGGVSEASCTACSGLTSSAQAKGTTTLNSSANVSLVGIGNAYSQSTGTGAVHATATATPGNPLGAKSMSSAVTDGATFTVGSGNYIGSALFDGTSYAGSKANADYSLNGVKLSGSTVADSGSFGATGAKISLASTNGQGAAGGSAAKAVSTATASGNKSLAECATDVFGKADTSIFTDASSYGNNVILDGVLLAPGASSGEAGSAATATATFSVK